MYAVLSLEPAPFFVAFSIESGRPFVAPIDRLSSDGVARFGVAAAGREFQVIESPELRQLQDLAYPIGDVAVLPLSQRRPDIVSLGLAVSLECDLRCVGCLLRPSVRSITPKVMTRDLVEEAVEWFVSLPEFRESSSIRIGLAEPLVHWAEVREAIRLARSRSAGVAIQMDTNLVTLTAPIARDLIEADVEIFTSLDGEPQVHNTRRVSTALESPFNATVSSIRLLLDLGMPADRIHVTATGMDATLPGISEEMFSELIDCGLRSFFVEIDAVEPVGEQASSLGERIDRLRRFCESRDASFSGVWDTPRWNLVKSQRQPLDGRFCGASRGRCLDLLPDGTVRHCGYLWTSVCSFAELKRDMGLLERSACNVARDQPFSCAGCPLQHACGGQCLVTRAAVRRGAFSESDRLSLCATTRYLFVEACRREGLKRASLIVDDVPARLFE